MRVYLPISQEQNCRTGLILSGIIFFLLFISSALLEAQTKPLARIVYKPDVTQETRDRQQSTKLDYSPLSEVSLEHLGIQNINEWIHDEELDEIKKFLEEKYQLNSSSRSNLLLSTIFSKIMATQTRAADWHSHFRPERIEFALRDIEQKARTKMKNDPLRGRRTYILRQMNKELRNPFPREYLLHS